MFIFCLMAASAFSQTFYIQYDDQGNVMGTVLSDKAPVIKDARHQISFDKEVDLTGKAIDIAKTVDGQKYDSSKDTATVLKVATVDAQAEVLTP